MPPNRTWIAMPMAALQCKGDEEAVELLQMVSLGISQIQIKTWLMFVCMLSGTPKLSKVSKEGKNQDLGRRPFKKRLQLGMLLVSTMSGSRFRPGSVAAVTSANSNHPYTALKEGEPGEVKARRSTAQRKGKLET